MGLVKAHLDSQETLEKIHSIDEAMTLLSEASTVEQQQEILEVVATLDGGAIVLVQMLGETKQDSPLLLSTIALLAGMDTEKAPMREVFELLKSEEAYIRNAAIAILQDYGTAIIPLLREYLNHPNDDLRIFTVNILGDVNFEQSRELMVELLGHETSLNVAMTAVDYIAEVGLEEDIETLNQVKERFVNEPYAQFAIDNAIRSIRG